jgi:hypothetical protein
MLFPAFQSREAAGTRAISVSPGPPLVVAICGEVDIQSAPELREELLRVIRRGGPQLIIDLGGVTFLDCAGLNMLVATRRRAQPDRGFQNQEPNWRRSPWRLFERSFKTCSRRVPFTIRDSGPRVKSRLGRLPATTRPPGPPAASESAACQPA